MRRARGAAARRDQPRRRRSPRSTITTTSKSDKRPSIDGATTTEKWPGFAIGGGGPASTMMITRPLANHQARPSRLQKITCRVRFLNLPSTPCHPPQHAAAPTASAACNSLSNTHEPRSALACDTADSGGFSGLQRTSERVDRPGRAPWMIDSFDRVSPFSGQGVAKC